MLKTLTLVSAISIGYYISLKIRPQSFSEGAPLSLPVKIEFGTVQGFVGKSRNGREFFSFLGLPYASPPVGNLRFESPQPVKKWSGVRSATEFGNECLQVQQYRTTSRGQEDCLYLNVYTPHKLDKNEASKNGYPVMVWIHGGLFVYGGSNAYHPHYFVDHDVVLVTVNYRLGAYGFLNTGDGIVRGNMGLKDQVKALEWVQKNIKYFGGNPERVSIFGESAGAASVHYHILSPMSKGLFQAGISQSGVVLSPWALQQNPKKQAEALSRKVNCISNSTKQVVECLKKLSAETLVQATNDVNDPLRHPLSAFVPTIEHVNDQDSFLNEHPESILRSGKINHVPWISGVNSHEGLVVTPTLFTQSLLPKFGSNLRGTFANVVWLPSSTSNEALEKIKRYYLGEAAIENTTDKFGNWTTLIGDSYFNFGHHQAAKIHSTYKKNPLYLYFYTYQSEFSLAEVLFAMKGQLPPAIEFISHFGMRWIEKNLLGKELKHWGSSHFDEVGLLFPLKGVISVDVPNKAHPDFKMSNEFVKAWVSFATDPSNLSLDGVKWPKVEAAVGQEFKYMQIDSTHSVIQKPFQDRMKFWDSLKL